MKPQEVFMENLTDDTFNDIIGQAQTKKQLLSALIMGRHVIVVGYPGVGKTTLAKNVAKLLPEIMVNDCGFNCDPQNPICPRCLNKKSKHIKILPGVKASILKGPNSNAFIGSISPIRS